jgi:hypothetical protein
MYLNAIDLYSSTPIEYHLQIVLALCLGSLTYGYTFSIVSTTLGQVRCKRKSPNIRL